MSLVKNADTSLSAKVKLSLLFFRTLCLRTEGGYGRQSNSQCQSENIQFSQICPQISEFLTDPITLEMEGKAGLH